ncbi:MAG: hypothetical protein WAM92_20260, partial [Mycobacterium sp.]
LAQLRRKLEDDPARPTHLLTEAGMGYRFVISGAPIVVDLLRRVRADGDAVKPPLAIAAGIR